jgi:radical SAM protein with 4Fe4S-binding SPASM domain
MVTIRDKDPVQFVDCELPGAVRLAEFSLCNDARAEREGPVRIVTSAQQWAYAAVWRIHDTDPLCRSAAGFVIRLEATIDHGRIGVAIAREDLREFITFEKECDASPDCQAIELRIAAPVSGMHLVLRNTAPNDTVSTAFVHRIQAYFTQERAGLNSPDPPQIAGGPDFLLHGGGGTEVFEPPEPPDYAEPIALQTFAHHNTLRYGGHVDLDSYLQRLKVSTPPEPWAYAAEVCLDDTLRHDTHGTPLMARIAVRPFSGEIGLGILGPGMTDLKDEVFLSATKETQFVDLPLPEPATSRGILIRNGSKSGTSTAEVLSIEFYRVPPRLMAAAEAVDGFLAACDTAAGDVVMFPPLTANLLPGSIRLVRLGGAKTLSRQSLLHVAAAAEAAGFAITAETKAYGTVLAVEQSRLADLPRHPSDWFRALLAESEELYAKVLRTQYTELHSPLQESMYESLSESQRPAQECVIFELANACNLACPMCPRNGRKIKDGLMRPEDAKRIISDIASSSDRRFIFYPHYLGETMIHPAIFEIIDHALTFPNIEVQCISNATLLDERRIAELLQRPITNYNFSIHECDQIGQAGVPPDQALSTRNVLAFLRRAEELVKRSSIFVNVSMVPSSFNDPAVAAFRDYWLGVADSVMFYACVALDRSVPTPEKITAQPGTRLPCTAPWSAPVVAYNGSVLPCCWDYEHSMVMGNLFEQSFEEIWTGPKFVGLRKALLAGDLSNHPTCASCEKWQQWVPGPPQVRLPKYYFTSNGTYFMFGSLNIDSRLLQTRTAALPSSPRWKHLPIYGKPRNWNSESEEVTAPDAV